MSRSPLLLDFTAHVIRGAVADRAPDGEGLRPVTLAVAPWDVAYRPVGPGDEGRVAPCDTGGDASDATRFMSVHHHLPDIAAPDDVDLLLRPPIEDLLLRRLTDCGQVLAGATAYALVPITWSPVHRNALRRLVRETAPGLGLRAMLPEPLCVLARVTTLPRFQDARGALHLVLGGIRGAWMTALGMCATHEAGLWQANATSIARVHLQDIDQHLDSLTGGATPHLIPYATDPADVELWAPVFEALSGRRPIAMELLDELDAPLGGLAQMVASLSDDSVPPRIELTYGYRFGIRLPSGHWHELAPPHVDTPWRGMRAFLVTQPPAVLPLDLRCGVTLADDGMTTLLASVDLPLGDAGSSEVIVVVGVSLESPAHGVFEVFTRTTKEPLRVEFTVPYWID